MKDFGSYMLYYIICRFLKLFIIIMGGFKIVSLKNVPRKGGLILAPNHVSYLDPPAVGAGTPRHVHFMAKKELFQPRLLGSVLRAVGSFPVSRGTADRKAIKRAIDLLEQGQVVCMFPEGTRSEDGKLGNAEVGVGLVALKSKVPVVPIAVIGTDTVLPVHGGLSRHPVKIVYGKPLTFPDLYEGRESREAMEEIGRRIMSAIAELQASHAS